MVTTLSAYIKSDAVKAVGKTGQYSDLIGAPQMSTYQTVAGMVNYVTSSDLQTQLSQYSKSGSGTSTDLTGYATTSYVTGELGKYAEKSSLKAVATSGAFSDLSGIDSVITTTALDGVLNGYVTTSNLIVRKQQSMRRITMSR